MDGIDQPFLFVFGFEGPKERLANERDGTDFESSYALWIAAKSADDALLWGRQVAGELVRRLFERAGVLGVSWADEDFASSISNDPVELERARTEGPIPTIQAGQMPDFSAALARLSD